MTLTFQQREDEDSRRGCARALQPVEKYYNHFVFWYTLKEQIMLKSKNHQNHLLLLVRITLSRSKRYKLTG